MEMPENLPSSIWVEAWSKLYSIFGQNLRQEELDLMDSVLQSVEADARASVRRPHIREIVEAKKEEREVIIKYLDEANDTRDLDKRLQVLKGEADA